ncbi:hypothetical protein CPLU01_12673 [Colletotrichum plurivorum]|uniref:Uncharacterized protein n=1 Tax=Colletotrichum plurivorum TaxID=2175906 RepID=A0A8H6JX01_9PEZI|nr:hypothetical protein CPLU01_12673 [Colletotrichum plurivorum]
MQLSTFLSMIMPLAMVSQVAGQKSFCRAAADSNTDFSGCTSIRDVCTTACPREVICSFSVLRSTFVASHAEAGVNVRVVGIPY